MVSVSAKNALLSGSVVTTKKAIVITFLVLGLAVNVQADVSGSISDLIPSLPDSNTSSVGMASTSSSCTTEAYACALDGLCMDCLLYEIDTVNTECENIYRNCDQLWDNMCCLVTENNATCAESELLFDALRECSHREVELASASKEFERCTYICYDAAQGRRVYTRRNLHEHGTWARVPYELRVLQALLL